MTDAQLARVPALFQEIVRNDREARAICRRPVIPFFAAGDALRRRRELLRHVERTYAPPRRDGNA